MDTNEVPVVPGGLGNTKSQTPCDNALARVSDNCLSEKDSRTSPCKNYPITIFKFPEDWKSWIRSMVPEKEHYYIFGYEICPETKRPHLQGFVSFHKKIRAFNIIKKQYGNSVRIKKMAKLATVEDNINYCNKDKDFISTFPIIKKKWKTFETYIKDFEDCFSLVDTRKRMGKLMYITKTYEVLLDSKKRKDICDAIWRYNSSTDIIPEDDDAAEARDELNNSIKRITNKKDIHDVFNKLSIYKY